MLSYQHAYHAGNLADLHKHALLASALDYLTRKDKPLSYIETHSGRGLYDLSAPEAVKTGEAAQGIGVLATAFDKKHPYLRAVKATRDAHGPQAYPGSPLVAKSLLRDQDRLHLAELHPAEFAALRSAMRARNVRCYHQDGLALAASLCPPEPRRGLMLLDPSWEVKTDYTTIPQRLVKLARAWNVGTFMLWYPILDDGPHLPMIRTLRANHPELLVHEVRFPPARKGHRMIGSGMAVINPPFGLLPAAETLGALFATAFPDGQHR